MLAEFTSALSTESAGEDFAIDYSSSDEEVPLNPRVPSIQPLCLSTSTKLPKKECEVNEIGSYSSFENYEHNKTHSPPGPAVSNQKLPAASRKGQIKIDTKESGIVFPEARFHGEISSASSGRNVYDTEPQSPVLGLRRTQARSCSPLIKPKKTRVKFSSVSGLHKVRKRKLTASSIASVKRQILSKDETVQIDSSFNAETKVNKEEQNSLTSACGQCVSVSGAVNCNTKTRNYVSASEPGQYDRKFRVGEDASQGQSTNSYSLLQPEVLLRKQSLCEQSSDHCIEQIVQQNYNCQSNSSDLNNDLQPLAMTDSMSIKGTSEHCIDHEASQNITVPSEGSGSQVDYNIELPLTPIKHSLEGTDASEVSFPLLFV